MATIRSITVETLVQTRQFENTRLKVDVDLAANDNPDEVIAAAQAYVNAKLGRGPSDAAIEAAEVILAQARAAKTFKVLKNVK